MRADRALPWLRRRAMALAAWVRSPPSEDPWAGLLPPLNRPTFPLWQRALGMAALVGTAGALLWPLPLHISDRVLGAPGNPDIPGAITVWMTVALHGWGLSDLVLVPDSNFPVGADLIARQAWPLDAVLSLPFHALFGWPDWINLGAWMWVAAMGWGAAWLGNRWWNDPWAGLACGVGYQACNLAALEVAEGRIVHVAAFAFLPVVIGLWIRALDRGTWAAAALCGAAVAGLELAYWFGALWVALAAIPPLLLTLGARRWEAAWVACTGTLATTLAGASLPMAWVVANLSLVPGAEGAKDATYYVYGRWMSAYELTSTRALLYGGGQQWIEQVTSPVAALLALVGAALWLRTARRVAYPLGLALLGVAFALGPYVVVGAQTIFLPYSAILPLPALGRMWWPMRFLAPTEVGLALLVGGLVLRVRAARSPLRGVPLPTIASLAVPAMLLGAAWQTGLRPFGMTPWPLDTAIFAGDPGTPVLAFPYPCAPSDLTNTVTWDQVGHQRPLVDGRVAPGFQAYTDPATAALHQRFPALDQLVRLGLDETLDLDRDDLASLRGIGVDRFYVDLDAFGTAADRVRTQIRALEPFTGPHEEAGRFWVVRLP